MPMNVRTSILEAALGNPIEQADGTWQIEFEFKPTDPTFGGHFPGHPILPGVYQVEMARLACEKVRQESLVLQRIIRSKFLKPVGPGERICVRLRLKEEEASIRGDARFYVAESMVGETKLILKASGA